MSAWNVLPIGDTLDGNKVAIRFRIVNIYEGYAEPKDVFVHVSDFLVLKHIAKVTSSYIIFCMGVDYSQKVLNNSLV